MEAGFRGGARAVAMATQEVEVTVPEGIFAGDEFLLEFDGQQLSVVCPDGCQGGDAINLQIPVNDAPAEGAADGAPNQVQVVVPEGCYPGDEFTVEFDGQSFNIGVPDGCGPGSELMVDVPQAEAAAPEPASTSSSSRANINPREMKIPPYRGKDGKVKSSEWHGSSSLFSMGPAEGFGNPAGIYHVGQLVQVRRRIPLLWSCMVCYMTVPPTVSVLVSGMLVTWACWVCWCLGHAADLGVLLADVLLYGRAAVWACVLSCCWAGQGMHPRAHALACAHRAAACSRPPDAIQVTRSDGSWTYGKIMEYDDLGDNYSIMTRAGPKHMVHSP